MEDLIQATNRNIGENIIKLLFAQLVNFLEFMQKENIVHRDLKPQNIMLNSHYNLKVIDFGDAKKVDEVESE